MNHSGQTPMTHLRSPRRQPRTQKRLREVQAPGRSYKPCYYPQKAIRHGNGVRTDKQAPMGKTGKFSRLSQPPNGSTTPLFYLNPRSVPSPTRPTYRTNQQYPRLQKLGDSGTRTYIIDCGRRPLVAIARTQCDLTSPAPLRPSPGSSSMQRDPCDNAPQDEILRRYRTPNNMPQSGV